MLFSVVSLEAQDAYLYLNEPCVWMVMMCYCIVDGWPRAAYCLYFVMTKNRYITVYNITTRRTQRFRRWCSNRILLLLLLGTYLYYNLQFIMSHRYSAAKTAGTWAPHRCGFEAPDILPFSPNFLTFFKTLPKSCLILMAIIYKNFQIFLGFPKILPTLYFFFFPFFFYKYRVFGGI